MTKPRARLGGVGVLCALVVSSGVAFIWPSVSGQFDPFRLGSMPLLGLVAITMFCLGLVVRSEELTELKQRP